MVKMMITVVIIYALCWLPLHTITLVGDAHEQIYHYRYIQVIWIACHWLAMSNSCYNPIVYCWMNSKFRNGFCYVMRWLPCIHYHDNATPGNQTCINPNVSTFRSSAPVRGALFSRRQQPSSPVTMVEHVPLTPSENGFSNKKFRNGCEGGRNATVLLVQEKEPLNVHSDYD